MRAQANMMEYVMMTFFIFIVLAALMIFLSYWQTSQIQLTGAIEGIDRAVDLADAVIYSPYFIKGNEMVIDPVLDDAKLMALNKTVGICDKLKNIFGPNWFAEVRIFEYEGTGQKLECTEDSYPDCNTWMICNEDREGAFFSLPVNVYRNAWSRIDIGVVIIGVYTT